MLPACPLLSYLSVTVRMLRALVAHHRGRQTERHRQTHRQTDRQTGDQGREAERRGSGAAGRREQRGSKSNRDAGDGLSVWLLAVWIRSI